MRARRTRSTQKISDSEKVIAASLRRMGLLSKKSRYVEAHRLALKMLSRFPKNLYFAYAEAVYAAEDTSGKSKKEKKAIYTTASKKLSLLLRRLRSASPNLRNAIRNEYYWFSGQPYKQYKFGEALRKKGETRGLYSAGVAAAQLAQQYYAQGNKMKSRLWAKRSEEAWLEFFSDVTKNWYNSYFFYAKALAFQGLMAKSEKALLRAAKIAGKGKRWRVIKEIREEIAEAIRLGESL